MAQIDEAEPFKVGFMAEKDSVVTLATALPKGTHSIRLMYVIEGYEKRNRSSAGSCSTVTVSC